MLKTTFDMIEPNVAETDVRGDTVIVTWKCPVSGKIVGKSEAIMQPGTSTARDISRAAQRSMLDAAIGAFVGFMGRTFGSLAGQVAGAAAFPAKTGAVQKIGRPVYDKASENAATLSAFDHVKDQFRWDENRELFVAASSLT
jgi:hypothetical protein